MPHPGAKRVNFMMTLLLWKSSISGVSVVFLPTLTPNLKEKNPNLRGMCWPGKCMSTIPGHTANNGVHASSTTDVLTKPKLLCEDSGHFSEKVMDSLINS